MNILYSNWTGFGAVPGERRILNTKCYRTYRGYEDICPDCKAKTVFETKRIFQTETILPDGNWVDLRVVPILDEKGDCMYFAEWVRVITDRKQMEEELQKKNQELNASNEEMEAMNEELLSSNEALIEAKLQADTANRAKSQFLSTMSHELRTPLNGVLGFGELLLSETTTAQQTEYVQYILKSATHLLDVVSQIMEFTQIQSGVTQLREEETDLEALCLSTIEMVRFQAFQKGLEISAWTDSALSGTWMIDPLRLKEVLLCLVGNAVKFTHRGHVHLRVFPLAKHSSSDRQIIRFSVEDTGIGIEKEAQERIFQFFEQADMSHTRKYGGTGLGLTVAQGILKLMESFLRMKTIPGKGSTFFFDLALQKEPEILEPSNESSLHSSEDSLQTKAKPASILVVEDDLLNARLVQLFLQKYFPQTDVVEARSGEEAVEIYSDLKPDMVLMDIQMPGIDGFEATRQIRQIEKRLARRVPVVAITAAVEEIDQRICLKAGMDDYLIKPLQFEETNEKLKKWIT